MSNAALPLLLLLLASGDDKPAPARRRRRPPPPAAPLPSPTPQATQPPSSAPSVPAAAAPWPSVPPSGLPPFPGSGWEYDEPPPAAVVTRAKQLVSKLWQRGLGAHVIEQTAGRWIAYQAAPTAVPKGVVAFRLKRAAAPAPAPALPSSGRPPSIPVSTPAPAPATPPEVGPAILVDRPTLRRGMGIPPQAPNEDVRVVQRRLALVADGQFGKLTEKGVKNFQRKNDLVDDGVVGPLTWAKLLAVRA